MSFWIGVVVGGVIGSLITWQYLEERDRLEDGAIPDQELARALHPTGRPTPEQMAALLDKYRTQLEALEVRMSLIHIEHIEYPTDKDR